MRRLIPIVLAAACLRATLLARSPEDLPRGRIIERVSCVADSQQTYALYIPSAYAPNRSWPILYLFDPSGRGPRAVESFQKAAEAYGFLLAGSNNSQNGPVTVSLAAAKAVWRDTHERFAIDDRRVFTAGFSGGSRIACFIGQRLAGAVAGVIGCGAGFPDDLPPTRDTRFAFVGLVGDADFNYRELRSLDDALAKLQLPHWIEVFSGPHQWPPEPFCTDAVEWMRVHEMTTGIGREDGLATAIFEKRFARAKEREAAGETLDAYREYAAIVRDFQPLRDVSAAAGRAAEYEKDGRLKKLLAAEQKLLRGEEAEQQKIDQTLESAKSSEHLPLLGALLRQLRVEDLDRRARSADREGSRSARRLLAWIFGRTSYTLSQEAIELKQYSRAIVFLSVAIEIRPESPQAWYNRACGWARAGNRKKALEDLRAAVEKGFRDRALIENDPDLASLQSDEEFRRLVESLPPREPAPGR